MLDKIDLDLLPHIDFMDMMELLHILEEGCEIFLDKINRASYNPRISKFHDNNAMT